VIEALQAMYMRGQPAHVTEEYKRLQRTGSAWSRGTVYGAQAVGSSMDLINILYLLKPEHNEEETSVLCVGCGDGLEMEPFAHLGYRVEGFDLDTEKVRVATYCGLTVRQGDAMEPPVPRDFYDVVKCSHMLEHLPDPPAGLRSLASLVKPGGLIYLVFPLEHSFPPHNPSHVGWINTPDFVPEVLEGWQVKFANTNTAKQPQEVTLVLERPQEEA
jgi:2-polyprenyl-3-methyl-5-hydroxy-6-metoxy-1,4-benzoquinol methylase